MEPAPVTVVREGGRRRRAVFGTEKGKENRGGELSRMLTSYSSILQHMYSVRIFLPPSNTTMPMPAEPLPQAHA